MLERAYANIREVERGVDVDQLSPEAALRNFAEATYTHHTTHPEFIHW